MYEVRKIPVPGTFMEGVAFLDIETRKVPAPSGFLMKNGEPIRMRWEPFLIGIGLNRLITMVSGDAPLLGVKAVLGRPRIVAYGATRDFDEMILKGRFTNARRAAEDVPFYPALAGADRYDWYNVGPAKSDAKRAEDTPSKGVGETWSRGDQMLVFIHNLRDIADLILVAGDPNETCDRWCRRILADTDYARKSIQRSERRKGKV